MSTDRSIGAALEDLAACMTTLRAECPWDRVQTHASLRRHLLEETHETLEVLDTIAAPPEEPARDAAYADLCEELGDVLFQVVFHSHIATESDRFGLVDVIDGVHRKLVDRHPAIFAPATEVDPTRSDPAAWERAKVTEKGRDSVMDGIPASLPALAYATKVIGKARAVAPDLVEDLGSEPTLGDEADLGERLLDLVAGARRSGLDAESTLRQVTRELEGRVRRREADHPGPHPPG